MNKKTTNAKTITKVKTKKTTKSPATKVKAVMSKSTKGRATTATAKRKSVARKGALHHVKRIYHLTPKFVHGMLVGAIVGLGLVSWVGSTGQAHANPAASDCIKTQGGINKNTANANVDVRLNCGPQRNLVLKAWYAQSANGQPHDTQRLLATSSPGSPKASDKNYTHIVVNLPGNFSGCFYQIDLVDVTHPASDNDGNPIVASITGGSHDCTPVPSYSCSTLHATASADRQVTIDQFTYSATNAAFSRATINWGDGTNPVTTPNVINAQHSYSSDGNYTLSIAAYFTITAQNGEKVEKVAPACTFPVTVTTTTPPPTTTTPGTQQVCELKTGKTVSIPEGAYDTTVYGPTTTKECNPTVTASSTPSTDNTSTLVKTGPGAILVILLLASIGGYISHHGHRHLKAKKHQRHAA